MRKVLSSGLLALLVSCNSVKLPINFPKGSYSNFFSQEQEDEPSLSERQKAQKAAANIGRGTFRSGGLPQASIVSTFDSDFSYFFPSNSPWVDLNSDGLPQTNEFGEVKKIFGLDEPVYFHFWLSKKKFDLSSGEVSFYSWDSRNSIYRGFSNPSPNVSGSFNYFLINFSSIISQEGFVDKEQIIMATYKPTVERSSLLERKTTTPPTVFLPETITLLDN